MKREKLCFALLRLNYRDICWSFIDVINFLNKQMIGSVISLESLKIIKNSCSKTVKDEIDKIRER
jgi:hypothetical protein